MTIFGRVVALILVLLVPVVALLVYSSSKSIDLIQDNLRKESLDILVRFSRGIEARIQQVSEFSIMLLSDPQVANFPHTRLYDNYLQVRTLKADIAAKLALQLALLGQDFHFAIFSPVSGDSVTVNTSQAYTLATFDRAGGFRAWTLQERLRGDGTAEQVFARCFSLRPFIREIKDLDLIIEAGFSTQWLVDRLSAHKEQGGDPFILLGGGGVLYNSSADVALCRRLVVGHRGGESAGNDIVRVGRRKYLVNYAPVSGLGAVLVDYVPLSQILAPLLFSRRLSYAVMGLLLLTAFGAALLLYRNVQVPIRDLVRGVKRLRQGQFDARVSLTHHNEFRYLFLHFNKMAREVDRLINSVYREQLRAQEATLKQLQSQINPHFLYNCLFFIKNMARMGDEEAVAKMAQHLGDYLRYTTRVEDQVTTLGQEVAHVRNYLSIQKLRSRRIRFDIEIPETMQEIRVPRLILQPVVENAVIHGIEPNAESGRVVISGSRDARASVAVEDDGRITEEILERLRHDLDHAVAGESGRGLANVHQRLELFYGAPAGIELSLGEMGGLRALLVLGPAATQRSGADRTTAIP